MEAEGYDLTGRVAIVTGGGSGIGKATAQQLARHGADVAIAGRDPETLARAAEALREATGRRILPIPTDVCNEARVDALVAQVAAEWGRIDILVNNAGRAAQGATAGYDSAAWHGQFALNTHGAFYAARAVHPHMAAQGGGAIVNVSSYTGLDGVAGAAAYSSAKAALGMFTRVTAAEWGAQNIRVNGVAPGITASQSARTRWAQFDFDYMKACRAFALGRPGEPEEVARAILFLASDAASYISGQTLEVIGGRSLGALGDD